MIGIDVQINKAVAKFNAKLWGDKDVSFNGRAYMNERKDSLIPEIYDSGEYYDVLHSDFKEGISFFEWVNPTELGSTLNTSTVNIYFAVNLEALYPAITERADEHAHADVLKVIKNLGKINYTQLTTGFESFEKFQMSKSDKDNMQPYHLFRVTCTIEFDYQNC